MLNENVSEVDVMLNTGDILRYDQNLKSVGYNPETEMFKIVTTEGDNFFPRESVATFFVKSMEETQNTDNVITFRT